MLYPFVPPAIGLRVSKNMHNGLGLLMTHCEIEIDYDQLLDIFARDYLHRLRLLDVLGEK